MLKQLVKRKLRKIGGSQVIILTKEILEETEFKDGDVLYCALVDGPALIVTRSLKEALRLVKRLGVKTRRDLEALKGSPDKRIESSKLD